MNLRIKGGRSCFYQWDSGQTVIVEHENTIHEVHFAHKDDERSLTVITKEIENGVEANVPNILLQSSEDIFAYLVFRDKDGTETRKAVRIPVIARPKPETYVYTETEVLNYAYLDERLKELEGEGLANAVADYLKENPIEAGATAEEAEQIQQNKTNIETLGREKLDAAELPEAVNDALAQAKASGEFKGEPGYTPVKGVDYFDGEPGDDYILTDADKTEIAELAAEMVEVPEGGSGASSIIDIEKYGITAIDYEPPFTEEMFHVAYANGVGIQKAIDDAKSAGLKELTIPAGNYPLCYHANAKDEGNSVIKTNGVNLFGYGVKLYVIYDENGVNPYYKWTDAELEANGGVQNHYILMGKVIEADSNVEGFEIVGERALRKHENTKYREFSGGIMISHWANSNVIKNCNIHHFSGDGICGNPTFENVYVSGAVDCPSGKMVNGVIEPSTNSWLSPRMGVGYSVDFTKPAQIASTDYNYFLWTKKQLAIHCFTQEEAYIATIRVSQGNPFLFPVGTFYVYVEMYSGGELTEESVGSANFRFGNMYYFGTVIDNCEVYLNQRGGISNVPSGSVIKNCTVHHNGGAYGDMVAFFDGTQFGIDIEDWYIDSLTIEGCTFYGQIHDVIFRCNKIRMKNCVLHNIFQSLNYAVDVWLENCKFHGSVNFQDSASFGDKFAINCTADYGLPAEIKVVGTAIASANLDADNPNLLVFKDASGAVVFSVDLSYLGKKPGEEIVADALLFDLDATKFTADALVLNDNTGDVQATLYGADCIVENGVVQPGKRTFGLVKCTWNNAPVLNTEMAFEVLCLGAPACTFADMSHKAFIGHGFQAGMATGDAENVNATRSSNFKSDAPYINASGGTGKPSGGTSGQIVLDDGTTKNSNELTVPDSNYNKYLHIVFNYHSDGTIVAYFNGYPCYQNPTTTDFVSWDFSSILNGFYLFHGNGKDYMASQVLMGARMYNRCLTKDEIRNNLAFEAKKLGY